MGRSGTRESRRLLGVGCALTWTAFVVACGLPTDEPGIELPPATLRPASAAGREQIVELERTVRELESSGAPAAKVAAELGEMGRLYHAFELLDGAQICYEEAQRLDADDWRWSYLLGYVHQRRGELEATVRGYSRAIELRPDLVPALHRLAEVWLGEGSWEQADDLWRRVLAIRPRFAAAHYGRGRVALNRGDLTSAVELLTRALELQPTAGRGHHTLGLAYRDLGQLEKAAEHLRLGGDVEFVVRDELVDEIPLLPTGSNQWVRRGLLSVRRGELGAAVASFRKAVVLDPSNREAFHNLALALSDSSQPDEAAETYGALIALDPDNAFAHSSLGNLALLEGRPEEAVGHLERAVELTPDFKQARYELVAALERLGRLEEALSQYEVLMELDPEFADVGVKRSGALVASGRRVEGTRSLQSRVSAVPQDAAAALSLSAVLRSTNRLEEAQGVLEKTLGSGDFEPFEEGQLRLELGRILALRDRSSEALRELATAQRLAPDLVESSLLAGLVQANRGRFADAARVFETLLAARPAFIPARLGLAQALQQQGKCSEAIAVLEEGLRLSPSERGLLQVLRETRRVCSRNG